MAAHVTWATFSVLADSHRPPPPHPALHPDAPPAVCTQTDPEVFFPGTGESSRHAVAACFACELRTDCYEWALTVPDLEGIWGGSTTRQRTQERARRTTRGNGTAPEVAA
jgi:hypothetical protein